MKFAHLSLSQKEVKKYNIRKLKRTYVFRILKAIEKEKMRKFGSSYCRNAMYDDMTDRCILMSIGDTYQTGYDLVLGRVFNKMLKIYKRNNVDRMSFYDMSKFNPIEAMCFRNQISEC